MLSMVIVELVDRLQGKLGDCWSIKGFLSGLQLVLDEKMRDSYCLRGSG